MSAMKAVNCMMIDVGYESGNDSILKAIKKGITVDQMVPFAREAKRAGLSVHGNWIIGLPGETKETINATQRMIKQTKSDAITIAVITPFPGTEVYKWAGENGYLITDDPNEYLNERGHQKSIISYPELSSHEIEEAVDRILKNYYLSPSYIPIALKRIFNRNGWNELKVLWRSAIAFLRYISGK
ncbi:B12-binding domain-containing radical SAM protein [Chloroflexota bacterium]